MVRCEGGGDVVGAIVVAGVVGLVGPGFLVGVVAHEDPSVAWS